MTAAVHLAGLLPLTSIEAAVPQGELSDLASTLAAKKGGTTNAPSSFRVLFRSGGVLIPSEEVHDD
jgi:hypothetical protein